MLNYFNIYIRQASTPFTTMDLAANALEGDLPGWYRLERAPEKPSSTPEPILTPMSDGNSWVDAEKVTVESGTMKVTPAECDYLRATYHNQLCDILFRDPNDDTFNLVEFGVRMNVHLLEESGSVDIIKIDGSRTATPAATSNLRLIVADTYTGIISGKILRADGSTAVSQATITITGNPGTARSYTDKSDRNGNFLFIVETPQAIAVTYTIAVVKAGLTINNVTVDVSRNGEYVKDVLATT